MQVRCEAAVWLGSFSPCSPAGHTLEEITAAGLNLSCVFAPPGNNLVAFYQDVEVVEEMAVEAGAELVLRCRDIGKYRLEGEQ